MTNRTFTMIKPDAFRASHGGAILDRIIKEGYRIVALKLTHLSPKGPANFMQCMQPVHFTENW